MKPFVRAFEHVLQAEGGQTEHTAGQIAVGWGQHDGDRL